MLAHELLHKQDTDLTSLWLGGTSKGVLRPFFQLSVGCHSASAMRRLKPLLLNTGMMTWLYLSWNVPCPPCYSWQWSAPMDVLYYSYLVIVQGVDGLRFPFHSLGKLLYLVWRSICFHHILQLFSTLNAMGVWGATSLAFAVPQCLNPTIDSD